MAKWLPQERMAQTNKSSIRTSHGRICGKGIIEIFRTACLQNWMTKIIQYLSAR